MPLARFATPLALASVLSAPATADTLASNLDLATGPGTIVGGGAPNGPKEFGFIMGADPAVLASVILTLDFHFPSPSPIVSIWSDSAGLPGVELLVLSNPPDLSGEDDYVFEAQMPFTLQANTSYWLHVRSEPATDPPFRWRATDPAILPTGLATAIGYLYNGNPSGFYNSLEIQCVGDVGTNYCIATSNSTGSSSTISATGSASIAANDLVLSADNLPDQPGIFIAGPGSTQTPFLNGFLCISPQGLQRFSSIQAPIGGVVTEAVDIATSTIGGLQVIAGQPFYFQRWYRDPVAGGAQANFSDGIELLYVP